MSKAHSMSSAPAKSGRSVIDSASTIEASARATSSIWSQVQWAGPLPRASFFGERPVVVGNRWLSGRDENASRITRFWKSGSSAEPSGQPRANGTQSARVGPTASLCSRTRLIDVHATPARSMKLLRAPTAPMNE